MDKMNKWERLKAELTRIDCNAIIDIMVGLEDEEKETKEALKPISITSHTASGWSNTISIASAQGTRFAIRLEISNSDNRARFNIAETSLTEAETEELIEAIEKKLEVHRTGIL